MENSAQPRLNTVQKRRVDSAFVLLSGKSTSSRWHQLRGPLPGGRCEGPVWGRTLWSQARRSETLRFTIEIGVVEQPATPTPAGCPRHCSSETGSSAPEPQAGDRSAQGTALLRSPRRSRIKGSNRHSTIDFRRSSHASAPPGATSRRSGVSDQFTAPDHPRYLASTGRYSWPSGRCRVSSTVTERLS